MPKTTRGARKMSGTMHRTSKIIKKTFNAIPGIKQVKGVASRGSKYVVTTIKRGVGKGVRKLSELRQRILKKFGFVPVKDYCDVKQMVKSLRLLAAKKLAIIFYQQ